MTIYSKAAAEKMLKSARVVAAGKLPAGGAAALLKTASSWSNVGTGVLQLSDGKSTGYIGIAEGKQIYGALCLPAGSRGSQALKSIFSMDAEEFSFYGLQHAPPALNQALKLDIDRLLSSAKGALRSTVGDTRVVASVAQTAARQRQAQTAVLPAATASLPATPKRSQAIAIGVCAALILALVTTAGSMIYAKARLAAAYEAVKKGNDNEAITEASQALSLDRNLVAAYQLRAGAYARLGNHPSAIADYGAVLNARPRDEKALLARACQYLAAKDAEKAAADAEQARKIDPNNADALAIAAMAHLQLQQFDAAVAACRKFLKQGAAGSPERGADVYSVLAEAHLQAGDYGQAILYFNKALALDANNSLLLTRRAAAFKSAGDYDHALADLNRALQINKDSDTLKLRAEYHQALGETKAALADLNEAVKATPQDKSLLDQWHDAELSHIRLPSKPHNQTPVQASVEEPDAAVSFSGDAQAVTAQGYELLKEGKTDRALQAFMQALKKDPNNAAARRYLAHTLLAAGQAADAVQQFDQLKAVDSLTAADHAACGTALERSGNTQRAIAEYSACLSAQPENAQARLALVDIYERLGDKTSAERIALEGAIRSTRKEDTELFRRRLKQMQRVAPTEPTAAPES